MQRLKRSGRIARNRARRWKILGAVLGVLTVLVLLGLMLAVLLCPVKDIQFQGNTQYSDEEMEKLIFTDKACYNSLYLFWKYNIKREERNIPFIEKTEISLISPTKVKVTTYEKGIVGYMEVLDSYVYFDKDGIVVEISGTCIEDALQVDGISTNTVSLGKKLPLKEDKIFKVLLNLTQLLDKHDIHPERVVFSEEEEMTLYFGEAKVALGKDEYMDEKIIRLKNIVSDLKERKGTLHMENLDEDTKNMTFTQE